MCKLSSYLCIFTKMTKKYLNLMYTKLVSHGFFGKFYFVSCIFAFMNLIF